MASKPPVEHEMREWRRLLDLGGFGAVVIAPDFRLSLLNEGFARMHGFRVADLEGQPIGDLFPPSRRAELSDKLRLTRELGHCRWDSENLRQDGSVFPVVIDLSAIHDEQGELLYFAGYVQDITEEKKADADRRRLASLVQSIDEAISSQTVGGTVLDWNPAAERVFGYSAAEMLGRSIPDILIPEELRAERLALIERALAGEPVVGFETQRIRKGGQRIWIALTLSPVRDAVGNLLAISMIERDITRQKKAQDQAALLASLVQSSNDAITAQAFDGTVLDWNAGAERVYGYTEAEALGRSIVALIVPGDRRDEREELTRRIMAGERVIAFETERVTKRRRRVPIALTLSPIRDAAGHILGVSTIERDITQQKKAQELGALLTSLVQSSDDAIVAHAVDATILDWNAGAERMYGYSEVEMLGQPITKVVPEDRRAEREALIQRVLSGERVVGVETERLSKDGRRIPIALTLSAIRDPGGRVLGISTIQRDITLLKQLERDRAEWASIVAHDLRQPTSAIRLASQMLARAKDDPARQRALEHIDRASIRLERMIEDLLDVSRIDAHRLSVHPVGVELAPLIEEVIETLPDAAARCRLEVAPDASVGQADPERFVQVVANLLSNAIKYGHPGTPIDVSVEPAGEMLMVTVTNEGPGISAEEAKTLFSRFVRTRSAQAGQAPGLGLGLYICRGIVEAHGGKLWVESTPGEKTRFRFTLPRATAAGDERGAEAPRRVGRSRSAGLGMR